MRTIPLALNPAAVMGAYVTDTDTLAIFETNGVSTHILFTHPINPNHPQESCRLIER